LLNWVVITARVGTEKKVLEGTQRQMAAAAELKQKVDSILTVVAAASKGDLTQEISVHGSDASGKWEKDWENSLPICAKA